MLRKMNIVMIICIIISGTALIAGEIVNQEILSINIGDNGSGQQSFVAPGSGKILELKI